MTVRANPVTMGGASTRSMAMNVHANLAIQVSGGWGLVRRGWSPGFWEGQVGQVAAGSTPEEQWCQIAYAE